MDPYIEVALCVCQWRGGTFRTLQRTMTTQHCVIAARCWVGRRVQQVGFVIRHSLSMNRFYLSNSMELTTFLKWNAATIKSLTQVQLGFLYRFSLKSSLNMFNRSSNSGNFSVWNLHPFFGCVFCFLPDAADSCSWRCMQCCSVFHTMIYCATNQHQCMMYGQT